MCGIAGEVGGGALAREEVRRMVAAMRHRGPDGEGFHDADGVALGMCRLAIIDVAGGDQPIDDGRRRIVYNGECYAVEGLRRELEGGGRAFRTRSDTEVVLHAVAAHGPAGGAARLNGMFAFAVWDDVERELVLVRDRLGKKPLYYWQEGTRLVFGSTLRALEARRDFAGTVDPEAVEEVLGHRFVCAPRTIYRQVKKLPPGHLARWKDGVLRVERWWDVPLGRAGRRPSADEAAEEVSALLADAARIRLVSERPVGLCLSSGIDSGLLAFALKDERPRAFTLAFAEGDFDESAAATRVARELGLPHHVLRAELDAERDLDAVIAHFDEPVGDPSGVALYELSRLVSQHVTVALSGTGGDELFGGYRRVLAGLLARATQHLRALRALPRLLGRDESKLGWRGQVARWAGGAGLPPLDCYLRLVAPGSGPASGTAPFRAHFARAEAAGASLLGRLLYTDLKTVLADDYLVKEDRMTMAHSVEARVPFLDYRLVELAFSLPDELKIRGLETKVLLRRLARRRLPRDVARAPKQGFEIPVAAWLRGALAPRLRALDAVHAFVDRAETARLVEEHLADRADHGRLLWTLLTLEGWLAHARRARHP